MKFPGQEYAELNSYSIIPYRSDENTGVYIKETNSGILYLTFFANSKSATMTRAIGFIECTLEFTYPNIMLNVFETEMLGLQQTNVVLEV